MTVTDRIRELSSLLEGTSIGLLEMTTPDGFMRLRREGSATPAPTPAGDAQPTPVRAPAVGVFRTAHPAQDEKLSVPGRRVAAGEAVGLVQVGMLLLHVPAPADGVLLDPLAADGDLVGYGAPLMLMEAQG